MLDDKHDGKSCYLDIDTVRKQGERTKLPKLRDIYAQLRLIGIRARCIRYERTRHGWHVVVYHNHTLTPAETVALQAVLGSDPKREGLNLMRALAIRRGRYPKFWVERFNILYKGKLR